MYIISPWLIYLIMKIDTITSLFWWAGLALFILTVVESWLLSDAAAEYEKGLLKVLPKTDTDKFSAEQASKTAIQMVKDKYATTKRVVSFWRWVGIVLFALACVAPDQKTTIAMIGINRINSSEVLKTLPADIASAINNALAPTPAQPVKK